MTQIVYQGQKYEVLDPYEEWTRPEASFIRKKTDLALDDIVRLARKSDPDAICALIYVAKKRNGEKVRWEDFDEFKLSQCEFIRDDEITTDDDMDEDERGEDGADPTSTTGMTRTRGSTTTSHRSRSASTSTRAKSTN